ncbi:MAG TPA: DNA-binding response regulator [Cryomorphaceae bacterium]|nr:two-component system response regulator [Owenweeksia sp.]MBF98554.1 two-component system response regulator [Owenweeksia sp.]HAD97271.1 DNA-binding response regulator [Cryomorphaceae bacterium]HBF20680.1 DNA-binding response regulator [Cryomorphaceae bacterium]|tara:strand:- start:884 stop:1558 length:675 start_codon:yes stop_codon:yes gene_type:complete
MNSIQVAIADDEKMFASLLHQFIEEFDHIHVIHVCHDGTALLEYLAQTEILPDIVMLDMRMQKMDGTKTLTVIRKHYPLLKVIMLSSYYQRTFMGFMLKSGVNAFLPKNIAPEKLVNVIEQVMERGHYFTEDQIEVMAEQISSRSPRPEFEPDSQLSQREQEVLHLICQQYTAREIGEKLFISQSTVEGHKNNLLLKTGMKNTAGLVLYAVKNNLINPEELPLL